jgi:hypothetical protein
MGPVVGFCGALLADLTLRALAGDATAFDALYTYDGQTDSLRQVRPAPRPDCRLCGVFPSIVAIDESRYTNPSCAA